MDSKSLLSGIWYEEEGRIGGNMRGHKGQKKFFLFLCFVCVCVFERERRLEQREADRIGQLEV